MSFAEHLLPLVIPARRAKEHGAIFYTLPEDLNPDQLDPLLREAVLNINLSGFCWTAESCQGHPEAAVPGDTAWGHNVEPYLRLVCHDSCEGDILIALMRACDPQGEDELRAIEAGYEHPQAARLYRYQRGEYAEIMVYLKAHNVMGRNGGIEVFRRFSERLLAIRDERYQHKRFPVEDLKPGEPNGSTS